MFQVLVQQIHDTYAHIHVKIIIAIPLIRIKEAEKSIVLFVCFSF